MLLWNFGNWLDDKLHKRERTVNEEVSLDRVISMLELSCFKDVKVTKYDFKDSLGLRNKPFSFLKNYFTPEDQDRQLVAKHSISCSKSGAELHRLLFSYSVKGWQSEGKMGFASSFWQSHYTPRSYPVFRNTRNALIEFYSKS